MSSNKRTMEILAPVGSAETVCAAVNAGADAIYFGAGSFNARRNAKNFSDLQIADTVKYCHVRGVRAYLTLNILVCDYEMNDALSVAEFAAKCGIDGIIIQDVGLAKLISERCPSLPLHASTQMSIHSLYGVMQLKKCGYKRVVLSREVSKTELEKIAEYANENGIELEIFVSGALCMSVSGQCLFSAMLGSRSGNRGLCAGTCRLPFSVDNGNGYDLSLKDMNLYEHFADFEKMKIASLKIEGRMKSAEYTAIAVDCARAARDNALLLPEKLDNLQKIFSRNGFTDGYYVNQIDKNMFGVRSEQDIEKSKEIMKSAHDIYRREFSRVGVDMRLELKQNEGAALTVCDGENNVTVTGEKSQIAKSRPMDEAFAKSKLEKCGGTPYYMKNLTCKIENGLTIPSSALNQMKSEALEALSRKRGEIMAYEWKNEPILLEKARNFSQKKKYICIFHSAEQIYDGCDADIFVLPLDTSDDILKMLANNGKTVAVSTPAYITDEQSLITRLCALKSLGVSFAVADNIGAIIPIKQAGLRIIGGAGLNIFNSYSEKSDIFEDVEMFTASAELSTKQINELKMKQPLIVNAYGRLQLMVLKNCPRKAHNSCKNCDGKIVDRMGIEFKLMCENGVTRLFADRPLYMADRLNEINCDYIVLRFTDETANEVEKIMNAYKSQSAPNGLFNRGLFSKGVL